MINEVGDGGDVVGARRATMLDLTMKSMLRPAVGGCGGGMHIWLQAYGADSIDVGCVFVVACKASLRVSPMPA